MDDVCFSAHLAEDIKTMMTKTEAFLDYTGMQVKHKKCATIHGRRTGNNWLKWDTTAHVVLEAQGEKIPSFGRDEPYRYLGFQIDLTGSAAKTQLESTVQDFKTAIENISIAPLPVNKRLEAINIIASSKLNFLFSNSHFTKNKNTEEVGRHNSCLRPGPT